MKSATLFSGFDGVGLGMKEAGLEHVWGLEYDDKIAGVARVNGFNTLTLNILDADPSLFAPVDVLHASPPCPNFSVAKANGHETPLDIALARKTADFIEVLRPRWFTLENVYQYRNSESWQIIANRLYTCGYWLDFQHVNMADYGVPQTRQRMIVRAVHNGFVPYLPPKEQWVGWYQAVEDLIPTLPPSQFAPWQLARLPENIVDTFIMEPTEMRDNGATHRRDEPIMTIKASRHENFRAFIVDGINGTSFDKDITTRDANEPMFTVTSNISKGMSRAWLARGQVVKMTPRALARFQTFPDWYTLPASNTLACKGIGNAVPPLFMAKMYRGLVGNR